MGQVTALPQRRTAAPCGMRLLLESELDGPCRGWDHQRGTLFRLVNGETWELSEYRRRQLYASEAPVRLWQAAGRTWLEIAGAHELLPVRRKAAAPAGALPPS